MFRTTLRSLSSPAHIKRPLRHELRKRPGRGINLVLVPALRGRAVFVDEVAVPLGFHQADVAGFELAFPRFPSRRFRAGDAFGVDRVAGQVADRAFGRSVTLVLR